VAAGLEAHALRTRWGWRITGDRNDTEANGSSVIGGAGLPDVLDSRADSARVGSWLEDDVRVGSRARVAGGVRVDWNGLTGETLVSPRLRATFDLGAGTQLRLATGRYTQSPGYEKLLQSDYFVDLSEQTAGSLRSERSQHYIAGLERELGGGASVRVEAYHKTFGRLIVGRLESAAETAARVAEYNFPAALASNVPSTPQITTVPGNGASGSAYGADIFLQKRGTSSRDRVSGWLSYTWGHASIESYGRTYPFDYDRRHALSLVSTWRVRPRIRLAATFRAASGFPDTRPVGLRVASELGAGSVDGAPGSLVPRVDRPTGLYVWSVDLGGVDNLNTSRLPVYARLDLRATYQRSPTSRWQFYLEAINALNRDNAGQLSAELQYNPGADRPSLQLTPDGGLPRLPSFGIRVTF
jgi:TonB-dependent receptor-like protein